jgi:hypothetical protein
MINSIGLQSVKREIRRQIAIARTKYGPRDFALKLDDGKTLPCYGR